MVNGINIFAGDQTITRAEMAKIIFVALFEGLTEGECADAVVEEKEDLKLRVYVHSRRRIYCYSIGHNSKEKMNLNKEKNASLSFSMVNTP